MTDHDDEPTTAPDDGVTPVAMVARDVAGRPRARRRTQLVAGCAGLVVAIVAAAVVVANRSDDTTTATATTPTVLTLVGAAAAPGAPRDAAFARPIASPNIAYRYHHAGAWKAGADTFVVYRLARGSLTDATMARAAHELGVTAAVRHANGNLEVGTDPVLRATPTSNGWVISLDAPASGSGPGSVGGSVGAGTPAPDPAPDAKTAATTIVATTPAADANTASRSGTLPSSTTAEQRARAIVSAFGATGPWSVEILDGGTSTVSNAPTQPPCPSNAACPPVPLTAPSQSRIVVLHRLVDGRRVDGLDVTVEFGADAKVVRFDGTLSDLARVGTYPLRTVAAVYGDVVAGKAKGTGVAPMEHGVAPVVGVPPTNDATPVTIDVQVDTAEVMPQLWFGTEAGRDVTYIVGAYHFAGHLSGPGINADAATWATDALALELGDVHLATP